MGGCIIYDDFRIAAGAELFNEWAADETATPDLTANDDYDSFSNGFEFAFGLDPNSSSAPFLPVDESGDLILQIPVSGTALSHGFQLDLLTSSDLDQWLPASDTESGVTLLSDTSSLGVDGVRRFLISPEKAQLFWQYKLVAP